jgi:bacteriocin-like protein
MIAMRELSAEELNAVSGGGSNGALGGQKLLYNFLNPKPSPCHR